MNQCPECPECPECHESQAELLGFPPCQTYCHIVQFGSQFERLVNRNKQEMWNINMKCPIQKSNGIMSLMAGIPAIQLVTQDTQDTQDTSLFQINSP
ncbi:MAG: hypothetical protein EZS28_038464 [Streblomastix strix]|uniref:Uncharacterized protein n=2 Tax=Streblomastix strix TaxID=222440 RepID=A0A5J4U600_9EUKA|nr:MAG: hypothetical protein EZS28_038464 [Streblomastix strix]